MSETAVKKYLPDSFTTEQREALFEEIVRLYDFANDVLAAVGQEGIINRNAQAELAMPFVKQVTHSANILAALYTDVARKNRPVTQDLHDTLERTFRSIFEALKTVADGMEEKLMPQGEKI